MLMEHQYIRGMRSHYVLHAPNRFNPISGKTRHYSHSLTLSVFKAKRDALI